MLIVLSDDLILEIFTVWISNSLKDLSSLDIACCCHQTRGLFLSVLLPATPPICFEGVNGQAMRRIGGRNDFDMTMLLLVWLSQRHVQVASFHLDLTHFASAVDVPFSLPAHTLHLTFNSLTTPFYTTGLQTLLPRFPQLTALDLSEWYRWLKFAVQELKDIAEQIPSLVILKLSRYSEFDPILLTLFPNLQELSCPLCSRSLRTLASTNPQHLRCVDFCLLALFPPYSDLLSFIGDQLGARLDSLTLRGLHYPVRKELILSLLIVCPLLTELAVNGSGAADDRIVDLYNDRQLTDAMQEEVATRCPHLKKLTINLIIYNL